MVCLPVRVISPSRLPRTSVDDPFVTSTYTVSLAGLVPGSGNFVSTKAFESLTGPVIYRYTGFQMPAFRSGTYEMPPNGRFASRVATPFGVTAAVPSDRPSCRKSTVPVVTGSPSEVILACKDSVVEVAAFTTTFVVTELIGPEPGGAR